LHQKTITNILKHSIMKTILKLSLAVLVGLTTITTYANNDDFYLNVKKGGKNEISFSVNEVNKAYITITDSQKNLIFSEKATGKGGLLKTYSLEEFPVGTYFLEVETNSKKVIHEIVISNESTTLSRKSIAEVVKSAIQTGSNTVAITK